MHIHILSARIVNLDDALFEKSIVIEYSDSSKNEYQSISFLNLSEKMMREPLL